MGVVITRSNTCLQGTPRDIANARRAALTAGLAGKMRFLMSMERLAEATKPGLIQLVLAEPYVQSWHSAPPWQHLQLLQNALHAPGSPLPALLHPAVVVLPAAGQQAPHFAYSLTRLLPTQSHHLLNVPPLTLPIACSTPIHFSTCLLSPSQVLARSSGMECSHIFILSRGISSFFCAPCGHLTVSHSH